jgi:predicted lipoprotein with Yx(FWY)xxD motif
MRIALLTLAAPQRAKVSVHATSLGRVLADAHGRTLYVFDLDARGRSSCNGTCAAAWPRLLTTGTPVALAGVPANRLATAKRGDGRLQVTFLGRPLYLHAADGRAGQVTGAAVATGRAHHDRHAPPPRAHVDPDAVPVAHSPAPVPGRRGRLLNGSPVLRAVGLVVRRACLRQARPDLRSVSPSGLPRFQAAA